MKHIRILSEVEQLRGLNNEILKDVLEVNRGELEYKLRYTSSMETTNTLQGALRVVDDLLDIMV